MIKNLNISTGIGRIFRKWQRLRQSNGVVRLFSARNHISRFVAKSGISVHVALIKADCICMTEEFNKRTFGMDNV